MNVRILDLGTLTYSEAVHIQQLTMEAVIDGSQPSTLIFVEHPDVLTLGADFHQENLLFSPEQYQQMGIEIVRTERGGDVTFHGPNQLVIYPIFDLSHLGKDLHIWLRNLEEIIIQTLRTFDMEAFRFPPHTGVWVETGVGRRKIAAIGIKIRRWVSMHGIALNCSNDLSRFDLIVPCGIQGFGVTSLSRELGREVTTAEAKAAVITAILEVLPINFVTQSD